MKLYKYRLPWSPYFTAMRGNSKKEVRDKLAKEFKLTKKKAKEIII